MPGAAQIPLTQQVDLTIADAKLLAEHPELHHYTKYAGLKGIIETSALRATHYRKLNDTMEINLLRQPLAEALGLRFTDVLRRRRSEREIAQAIEETGGLEVAAQLAAEGLVNSFYQVSFDRRIVSALQNRTSPARRGPHVTTAEQEPVGLPPGRAPRAA